MQTVIDFLWNLFTVTVSRIDCSIESTQSKKWKPKASEYDRTAILVHILVFSLNRFSNKHLDLRSTLLNKWWRHLQQQHEEKKNTQKQSTDQASDWAQMSHWKIILLYAEQIQWVWMRVCVYVRVSVFEDYYSIRVAVTV